MASDANFVLQALVTKTTAFNSLGLDHKTGTPRRGLKARIEVANHGAAGLGAVHTFQIADSADNTAFTVIAQGDPFTAGTAAASFQQSIPYETSRRYVRLQLLQAPTTSSPSVVYQAEVVPGRPG